MTTMGMFFIGIVVIVAITYTWFFTCGERVFGNISRKAIDKCVTKEQGHILKAHLSSTTTFGYKIWFPLLTLLTFSAFNVYGLSGFGGSFSISRMLIVGSTLMHTFTLLILIVVAIWALSEAKKSPRFCLPILEEYMADKEAHFIFWLVGKEDDYDSEFLNKTAVFPENLVPILENWESVQKFALAYDRLRKSLKGKEEYLSPRQYAQQKELIEELREKSKGFVPFYQLLLDAVDKKAMDEKEVKRIQEIKEDIPMTLEQMAKEIRSLEEGKIEDKKVTKKEEDGTVLQELKRVAESNAVSAGMRKEATELISFIETRHQKEVVEREREMEQLDALAVIQASRIFYGISEEEMERE